MAERKREDVVILGAGLAGLSAGYALAESERRVALVEAGATVGGMSRTVVCDGYRFDLGGHRFFTTDKRIDDFVRKLMGTEMLSVPRKSKIYLEKRSPTIRHRALAKNNQTSNPVKMMIICL